MNSLRLSVGFLCLLLSLGSGFANTFVRFQTTLGDFEVELFDNDKPVTVGNFLRYVQDGYYTNTFFHRVYTNGINIIQGGGFRVVDRGAPNADLDYVTTFAPIKNEAYAGKFYSNVYGTIAMAKTSDPNSATSQFFFNLADNSTALDNTNNAGGFTVFGRVIAGTNTLNNFLLGETNHLLKRVNAGSYFTELPVLYSAVDTNITVDDLIYVAVNVESNAATNPVPPYVPLKATYSGLCAPPTNVATGVSGLLTLTTTAGPKFSGNLRLGAARYAFSGAFDTNGYAVVTATSGKRESLVLNLHPDAFLGTEKLVGTVSSTAWMADLQAYRAAFDARTNPATNYQGKYTLTLPSSGQANTPGGYGYATLSVNPAGRVTLKGALADGTPWSQTVPLARDGHFPLYASLYAGGGFLAGWMTWTNQSGAELSGSLRWYKPASNKGLFPGGFVAPMTAVGGRYTALTAGASVLSLTNSIIFGGDSSLLSFTNTLVLKSGYKLLNTSTNKLTVSLNAASGAFSGTVKPPGWARSIPFKGALWQHSGYGYFLDAGQSGWVMLQP